MSKHSALITRVTNKIQKRLDTAATPGRRYTIILDDDNPISINIKGGIFPNVPMPSDQLAYFYNCER